MPEYFDFNSTEMSTVPVWIKLPNLPLRCWSLNCLSQIASVPGKPIQCDMLMSSMARLSCARILVEIDLLEDLPQSINICLSNGASLVQQVIYETLPKFCGHCRVGHVIASCSKAPKEGGFDQDLSSVLPAAAFVKRMQEGPTGLGRIRLQTQLPKLLVQLPVLVCLLRFL